MASFQRPASSIGPADLADTLSPHDGPPLLTTGTAVWTRSVEEAPYIAKRPIYDDDGLSRRWSACAIHPTVRPDRTVLAPDAGSRVRDPIVVVIPGAP